MRHPVLLLLLSAAFSSQATFITEPITAGTADLIPSTLFSTSGLERFSVGGADFSFTGSGNQLSPYYSCGPIMSCPPGAPVFGLGGDMGTGVGVAVSGNITFQGTSYDYTALPQSSTTAWLTLPFGGLTTPGSNLARNITLSGSFHAAASFLDPNFQSDNLFTFTGQGTVTLNLALVGNSEVGFQYGLQSMHFDFVAVPEPSTASYIAALMVGCGICRVLSRK